jgi:CO/xanthine dehydrogenase Mo-binding subunit
LHTISNSVVKKDHAPKMEGRSVYVCDIDKHGVLCGKMLRSKYARAKLLSVKVPELPDGYYYVDRSDVPGDNNVNIVMDDTPVYARETVEYIGEPIGMVCGPDEAVCEDILRRIEVEYEELEPMLDLRKADEVFFNYEYEKGDIDKAFAEADKVYEEEFETGYQDQT